MPMAKLIRIVIGIASAIFSFLFSLTISIATIEITHTAIKDRPKAGINRMPPIATLRSLLNSPS